MVESQERMIQEVVDTNDPSYRERMIGVITTQLGFSREQVLTMAAQHEMGLPANPTMQQQSCDTNQVTSCVNSLENELKLHGRLNRVQLRELYRVYAQHFGFSRGFASVTTVDTKGMDNWHPIQLLMLLYEPGLVTRENARKAIAVLYRYFVTEGRQVR